MLIKGNITDSATGEELFGVNIKILQNGVFTQKGLVSDFNGEFSEDLVLDEGIYEFEFSYIGYNNKIINKRILPTTAQLDFGTVKLKEKSEELAEFEVVVEIAKGKIVDDQNNPIAGAIIKNPQNATISNVSDPSGDFTISINYTPKMAPFKVEVSAVGYSQTSINPFNGPPDNTVKKSLGVIILNPIKVDLAEDKLKELPLEETQVQALKLSKIDAEAARQLAMNKVITTIKTVLLPTVLSQLASFGISKVQEAIMKNFQDINVTCPSNIDELNKLIEKKNRLVKALNNIYNFLNSVKIGVQVVDSTLTAAQVALAVIENLTLIPSTVATPIPPKVSNIFEQIDRELKKYKLISATTLMVLTILIELLNRILNYLKLLDQVIGHCALEGSLPQEQLSNDLLLATQQQSQQLSPVVTNVNGFEMGVITVDNVTIGGIKRRRAVARNKSGVIMLQGEPSFSSNDQILIDELVFYIQQNDLKAE